MHQVKSGAAKVEPFRIKARITQEGWARCQGTHPKGGVCDRVLAWVEGPTRGVSIKCPRCSTVNEITTT